jgi:hypothetical protein
MKRLVDGELKSDSPSRKHRKEVEKLGGKLLRMQSAMAQQKTDIDRLERQLVREKARSHGKLTQMTELNRTVHTLQGILDYGKGEHVKDATTSLPYLTPVKVPAKGAPLPIESEKTHAQIRTEQMVEVYNGDPPPTGPSSADMLLTRTAGIKPSFHGQA